LLSRVTQENRLLKELRASVQEARLKNKQKPSYSIYGEILILIFSIVALVFVSVYLLEAIYILSEKLKLSKTFVKLVIILSTLVTVNYVVAIMLRAHEQGLEVVVKLPLI
jgi:Ca2+/H+ antiporter